MNANRSDRRVKSAAPSWGSYRRSIGDRSTLFAALAESCGTTRALYPGSYLDLSPSTAIPSVTYVDTDRRAARFFSDDNRVATDLKGRCRVGAAVEVVFVQADYTTDLPLPDAGFDLIVSLYAGLVWDHCRRYLAPGGLLLANTSHGDGCIAALDPDLTLVAAVHQHGDHYRVDATGLETYLQPTVPAAADAESIRRIGKGITYTRGAFAYVFAYDADQPAV